MIRFVLTKHTGTEVEHKIMGQTRMNEEEKKPKKRKSRIDLVYYFDEKELIFNGFSLFFLRRMHKFLLGVGGGGAQFSFFFRFRLLK